MQESSPKRRAQLTCAAPSFFLTFSTNRSKVASLACGSGVTPNTGFGQSGFQQLAIRVRSDRRQFGSPLRAGDVAADQRDQGFVFQGFSACILHGCEMLFR